MKLHIFLFHVLAVMPLSKLEDHTAAKDSFDEWDGNAIINELIRMLFVYIRQVILNGSKMLAIPRLDPYELEEYQLQIPAGPINFNLQIMKSSVSGLGTFVVHGNHLTLPDLTFDLDISIPRIDVNTDHYDVTGTFSSKATLPFYGKGKAKFVIEGYRWRAKLYLKQSDNGKSLIIDKIEGASFEIPVFESKITGTIGENEIDPTVNALVDELVTGYVNEFSSAIAYLGSASFVNFTNPILEQINTWRFISPFI